MLAEIGRRNDKTYRICHPGNPGNRGVPFPVTTGFSIP